MTKIKTWEHKDEHEECAGTKTHNVIVGSVSPQQTLTYDTADQKKKVGARMFPSPQNCLQGERGQEETKRG